MGLITRGTVMRHFCALFVNHTSRQVNHNTLQLRQYISLNNKSEVLRYYLKLTPMTYVCYSDEKRQFIKLEKKSKTLKDALQHQKEQLRDTEHRIRQRSEEIMRDIKHQKEVAGQRLREKKDHLVQDILDTKAKVRERFEGVIEVTVFLQFLDSGICSPRIRKQNKINK